MPQKIVSNADFFAMPMRCYSTPDAFKANAVRQSRAARLTRRARADRRFEMSQFDPNSGVTRPTASETFGSAFADFNDGVFDAGIPQSFVLILLTEIGDKTFFLAMMLAARHGKLQVFLASISALFFMTLGSALAGYLVSTSAEMLHSSVKIMDWVAAVLFVLFGAQMLWDARKLHKEDAKDEEVAALLGGEGARSSSHGERADAEETLREKDEKSPPPSTRWEAFARVFSIMMVAEWGDRSMFATLTLATKHNPAGVVVGAMAAHAIANALAVVGGELLSKRISEKLMATLGGLFFVGFGALTAYEAYTGNELLGGIGG